LLKTRVRVSLLHQTGSLVRSDRARTINLYARQSVLLSPSRAPVWESRRIPYAIQDEGYCVRSLEMQKSPPVLSLSAMTILDSPGLHCVRRECAFLSQSLLLYGELCGVCSWRRYSHGERLFLSDQSDDILECPTLRDKLTPR
jgi:hypothetical protein